MPTSEPVVSNITLAQLVDAVISSDRSTRFQARGFSMCPLIRDGDFLTITPLSGMTLRIGMVVAFRRPGSQAISVHRIIRINGAAYLIRGDNSPGNDGWIVKEKIIGYVSRIEHNGKERSFGLGRESTCIAWLNRAGFLYFGCRIAAIFRRLTNSCNCNHNGT